MNGQSGTATLPPRKLGMTSSELSPHVPNNCKYSESTLHFFPGFENAPPAAALRDQKLDLANFKILPAVLLVSNTLLDQDV